jgi:hypothetical protein
VATVSAWVMEPHCTSKVRHTGSPPSLAFAPPIAHLGNRSRPAEAELHGSVPPCARVAILTVTEATIFTGPLRILTWWR